MKKLLMITLVLILGLVSCESNASDPVNTNVKNENTAVVENTVEENDNAVEESDQESASDEATEELAINKPLPNFEFQTLAGDTIRVEDYKGKIIMLNFWATWCTYCDQEMPDLETVNQYDDVVVLALNSRESKEIVEEYINQGAYTFDVILDEVGYYSDLFYINSFPTTFFINEEGLLLGAVPGMMALEDMDNIINKIRNDEL